ncbi:hypothetical protein QUF50_07950 [Thiotrichales bacterium HSG1]|nr:hypothetical protein [Thiotrichales bacterium HSG1]
MSESVLQISGSLLTMIQQAAEKNHLSVNQFLLTAAKNSLATVQSEQTFKNSNDLCKRWENYFATARLAPEEFMEDIVDELPQQRIL